MAPSPRKRSLGHRVVRRGRELRKAAPQLDIPWARSWAAGVVRAALLRFLLRPLMNVYTRRGATGGDKLSRIKGPVILVTVMQNGPPNLAGRLGLWFLYCAVVGLFVAYITGRALPPGSSYLEVFRFAGCTARARV